MQFGIQYQKGIHSTKQIQSRVGLSRVLWKGDGTEKQQASGKLV